MKKLLPISLLFLASGTFGSASAQNVRVGVKAGLNYSSVTENLTGNKRRLGPAGGIFAQVPLSSDGFFLLQPELLYSIKGSRPLFNNAFPLRLRYLDLPLLAKINADGLFFELGPQVSYLIDVDGGPFDSTRGSNRVTAGGVAGVGCQLPVGLGLGVRYTHDLTRLSPQGPRNTVFQAQASYLLGNR
ncbi:porin family protein [Hymenobacter sp. BT190]|uniref:porin family protein n=1 Tax=Hymenobacter sp. BT190 TaxID=2763505 RepID=UPI0016516FD5|nr:porin family protein [Hymenobacter sp. BT190]MBC6697122.1 PorT family protein [Hymenobacter sp. BT190]